MARGKRYKQAYDRIDRTRSYEPAEAVSLVKSAPGAKFDETVELHIRLGVNVRHAEEQLRGTLALPRGLGKDLTVAVFAEGDQARQATDAGADHVIFELKDVHEPAYLDTVARDILPALHALP